MKVLVVDDHALIRDAMRGVLSDIEPDAQVVEASTWSEAVAMVAAAADLDLILLDIGLPDRDGFAGFEELRRLAPATSIAVLSAREDRATVTRALDSGAVGFIPKSAPRAVLVNALKLVLAGGMYLPPELLGRGVGVAAAQDPDAPVRPAGGAVRLTGRQRDVLALMMKGYSNKAICRALDLAEPTVKNHVTAILKELNVANRTQAVVAAQALGLADDAPGQP